MAFGSITEASSNLPAYTLQVPGREGLCTVLSNSCALPRLQSKAWQITTNTSKKSLSACSEECPWMMQGKLGILIQKINKTFLADLTVMPSELCRMHPANSSAPLSVIQKGKIIINPIKMIVSNVGK